MRGCEYNGVKYEEGKVCSFLECMAYLHEAMITEMVKCGYFQPIN